MISTDGHLCQDGCETLRGEIVKIIDLPANDSWTKPCKLRVHNEDGRNTMKPIFGGNSNFRWKFMACCQKRLNAGNCAKDLMIEAATQRRSSKRKLQLMCRCNLSIKNPPWVQTKSNCLFQTLTFPRDHLITASTFIAIAVCLETSNF